MSIKLAVVSRAGRGQYDIFGFDPTLGLSPRGCEESTGSGKQEGFAFGMDFGKAVGVIAMISRRIAWRNFKRQARRQKFESRGGALESAGRITCW